MGKYHMTHDIVLKGFSDWSVTHIVADVNIMCLISSTDFEQFRLFNEPPKQHTVTLRLNNRNASLNNAVQFKL